jgi:hypothetical protein
MEETKVVRAAPCPLPPGGDVLKIKRTRLLQKEVSLFGEEKREA